jgi:hypothetical protein
VIGAMADEMETHWPIPVVHARELKALLAYYRKVLRFELLQEISGVVAVLRKGQLRLQLWQSPPLAPQTCTIPVRQRSGVFQLYAELAKVARSAIVEECPRLRAWGAWEFSICDPQGNVLTFTEPQGDAGSS